MRLEGMWLEVLIAAALSYITKLKVKVGCVFIARICVAFCIKLQEMGGVVDPGTLRVEWIKF